MAIERAYEEAQWIADDKPEAALRWLDGLFQSTDRLEAFPESGPMVPEIGSAQYRQIIYRSHRVIYRLESNGISILTVRRSKRLMDISELQQ